MTESSASSYAPTSAASLTNGYAVASLVLGAVWVFWIGSLLAVIFGYAALSQNWESGRRSGHGMAMTGFVLGCLGLATLAVMVAGGGHLHIALHL